MDPTRHARKLLLVLASSIALTSCLARTTTSSSGTGAPSGPANDPPQGHGPPSGDPPPGAPGLRARSGDGQVAVSRFAFPDPLAVQLTDSGGKPISGATISWSSSDTQGGLALSHSSTTTDADGLAQITVTGGTIGPTESSRLIAVTASVQSGGQTYSRTFNETVALALPSAFFLQSSAVYSVPAGGTAPGAMKIAVLNSGGDSQGLPLPKVALTVTPIVPAGADPSTLPSVSCAGGVVLTDVTGEATCDLVAGPVPGTIQLQVSVGRFVTYDKSSAQVTP
jgi:hypothetical protein